MLQCGRVTNGSLPVPLFYDAGRHPSRVLFNSETDRAIRWQLVDWFYSRQQRLRLRGGDRICEIGRFLSRE